MRIYTINPTDIDDIKFYEAHLYKEAKPLRCTERAILYNVLSVAGFIVNNLKKAMLAEPVNREIIFDSKSMLFMKRRWNRLKRKNLTEEQKEEIASTIDNEGFWYALTMGGYLKPEDILENEKEINKVKEAIDIVREFEEICPQL